MTDRHFVTVDPDTKALPASVISGTGLFTSENDARLEAKYLPRDDASPGVVGDSAARTTVDLPISGVFTSNYTFPDFNATVLNSNPTSFTAAWDALQTAHPDYITRTTLATDGSVDDFPIYLYDFNPSMPSGSPEPFKVIIVAGQHGLERTGMWTAYNLAENIALRWDEDPTLEALRFNARFLIMPLLNPSGMKAGTRKNHNGVDLNRNWTAGWTLGGNPAASDYGGTAPLSEPETAAASALIDTHDDALMVIDVHNFMNPGDSYQFLWNVAGNTATQHVCAAMIRRMDRKWKTELPDDVNQDPAVFAGYVTQSAGTPTLAYDAATKGFPGALTFEHCRYFAPVSTTQNTATTMTYGYEALVNLIALSIENL